MAVSLTNGLREKLTTHALTPQANAFDAAKVEAVHTAQYLAARRQHLEAFRKGMSAFLRIAPFYNVSYLEVTPGCFVCLYFDDHAGYILFLSIIYIGDGPMQRNSKATNGIYAKRYSVMNWST